ncbi:hypothetical protein F4778DRAFT_783311 [Xylariomycetidae sp. FL2044]|nr:hypothetical protein F4778DRAFT_783311 [Xylariomycetidae sp. FL2044]
MVKLKSLMERLAPANKKAGRQGGNLGASASTPAFAGASSSAPSLSAAAAAATAADAPLPLLPLPPRPVHHYVDSATQTDLGPPMVLPGGPVPAVVLASGERARDKRAAAAADSSSSNNSNNNNNTRRHARVAPAAGAATTTTTAGDPGPSTSSPAGPGLLSHSESMAQILAANEEQIQVGRKKLGFRGSLLLRAVASSPALGAASASATAPVAALAPALPVTSDAKGKGKEVAEKSLLQLWEEGVAALRRLSEEEKKEKEEEEEKKEEDEVEEEEEEGDDDDDDDDDETFGSGLLEEAIKKIRELADSLSR